LHLNSKILSPGIFILIHGINNDEHFKDSTYTDKEGLFYFMLSKGNYTVDIVFKDEERKYKDAYQNHLALPIGE